MSVERLRQDAHTLFQAGLVAVDPMEAIKRHVSLEGSLLRVGDRQYDLDGFDRVFVVGAGKAGASMSQAIEELLPGRISAGIVVVKHDHLLPTRTIELVEAGHPLPDEDGTVGARRITDLVTAATGNDLVICLLSGGGSALLPAPAPGISLAQKQEITELLLASGATINQINAVRKHISTIKGGQLARSASPATLITLILSDVIGDPLDAIASGPTVADSNSFGDCWQIIETFGLKEKIPEPILSRLRQGMEGRLPETPKPGDSLFKKTQNLVIAGNGLALQAAAEKARQLQYNTMILSTFIEGETREVAKVHTAILKEILKSGSPLPRPACVLSGGETTVTIQGDGLGGRNQEFVLAAAIEIEDMDNVVCFSAGTDGTDGPTDAAGAIADGATVSRARAISLDPQGALRNNDSYHFFDPLGDLLRTGPTNTNVIDLRIMLAGA
ncbi:MAG: glycerate kinase [Planctomycetes bacterium]|nr:glycerate kinase [Planctomycetota bacterium]